MPDGLSHVRKVLMDCNHAIVNATEESGLLQQACGIAVEGGYQQAWVGALAGDASGPVVVIAAAGGNSPGFDASRRLIEESVPAAVAQVIAGGKLKVSREIPADQEFVLRQPLACAFGGRSSVTLPLFAQGKCVAAIVFYSSRPDAFDAEEVALLENLAQDLSAGIEALRMRAAREQAEVITREHEERFRETFNQMAVGIAHTAPPPDRRYLLINQKFCDMLGYSADELKQMSGLQLTHPDDVNSDHELEERLIRGEISTYVWPKRYIRKDGKTIWASRTISLVRGRDGNPKYFIRVVEDITERREMEERFHATFEQAAVGLMHISPDRRILMVNRKICDMLGYPREELLRMATDEIMHVGTAVSDDANYLQPMLDGRAASYASERVFRKKDGSTVCVNRTVSLVRDPAGKALYFILIVEDISDRKRAEVALRESEEKFRQLADNIPEVFWMADVGMRKLLYLSPVYEKVTGKPVAEAMKRLSSFLEIVHPDDERRVRVARRAMPRGGDYSIEYRIRCADGSLRWIHEQAYPVRDSEGRIYRIAGIASDITQRKLAEEKLVHLAHYDSLTGLPNRILFRERLGQALDHARRKHLLTGVMMLGLDRFKVTNDSLGHRVGDLLLKQVAERLGGCVQAGTTLGRVSGDEFGFILDDLKDIEAARVVARTVLESLSAPFLLDRGEVYVTASVGISLHPTDGDDVEVLIKSADTALHHAKDAGRNNYQFFTAEMNARAQQRMIMANSLRRAFDRNEFLLYYQPKASLNSGVTTGVEALLRWEHPELGLVSPGDFVPLLEETGLIVPVGEWVFSTACIQIKAWEAAGINPVPVAINLSSRQFLAGGLGSYVRRMLDKYNVDPQFIELEITESALMANTEDAVHTLQYLESIGVWIAVDDFGTGYSSLSYLRRFPLGALKIDGSFVREVTSNAGDAAIVRAIISMANSLGLKVVAEGVETEAQMSFLAANNCDEIQGYYLSQPLTAEKCTEWLRTKAQLSHPVAMRGSASTVLLVDDDDDMLALFMRALSQDGYYILTARNAIEAFDVLSRHEIDVVIADHHMPGMEGVEFLQRVKALHPDTVRIMCSAVADFQTVTDAVNKGEIFRFLPKDADPRRLRLDVREALFARANA